jgi:hypothetical protein
VIQQRIVRVADPGWFGQSNTGIALTAIGLMPHLDRQVEGMEHDAHQRLNIGTRKSGVARYFAEHNFLSSIVEFQLALLRSA